MNGIQRVPDQYHLRTGEMLDPPEVSLLLHMVVNCDGLTTDPV